MTLVMTQTRTRKPAGLDAATLPPRDRMVQSAAILLMERGVAGTGMREIAEHANAPRGSLQHYFPDGKEQVVVEALHWIREQVTESITSQLAADTPVTARAIVGKQFGRWRKILERSDFLAGCPVVATLADATADETLRAAAQQAFDSWRDNLTRAFRAAGVSPARARRLALLVISSLEGAIAMARAERDLAPLVAVGRDLEQIAADWAS